MIEGTPTQIGDSQPILTEKMRWTSTWKTTKPTSIQSIHSGSSALGSFTEKKMATTAMKGS